MAENPGFENTHKFYEYTAEDVQKSWDKKLQIAKKIYSTPEQNGIFGDFTQSYQWVVPHQG